MSMHREASGATRKVTDNINRPQPPSLYDTVLGVTLAPDVFSPQEQESLNQAINQAQRPEGSFLAGAWPDLDPDQPLFSAQGALLTTLAVCAGYTYRGWEIPNLPQAIEAINELCLYSTQEIDDNIAAEVLIPTLVEWTTTNRSDFALSEPALEYIQSLWSTHGGQKKLFYLLQTALDGVYAFNTEILAFLKPDNEQIKGVIPKTAQRLAKPNGFYGSLAATAGASRLLTNHGIDTSGMAGLSDLRQSFDSYQGEGLPHFAWSRNFAFSWYMRAMILAGLEPELFKMGLMGGPLLSAYWQIRQDVQDPEKGISWDSNNDQGDLDDTGSFVLAELSLWRYGLIPDRIFSSDTFDHFQYGNGDYYCFYGESNLPISAAMHAVFASLYELDILAEKGEMSLAHQIRSHKRIERLIDQVLRVTQGRFGVDTIHDKWHLSWTYVAEVLLSSPHLRHQPPYSDMLVGLVKEIVEYQHRDGSWGITSLDGKVKGTLLETSYIINGLYQANQDPKFQSLLGITDLGQPVEQALLKGSHYLANNSKTGQLANGQVTLNKLYRGKVPYGLTDVDRASLWNAKHYANQTLETN